ncbi:MAG: 4Fe-4S dicluster domain-containing protein [Proteobacteria bacterium]|nr:4Fe-4S dicluster domain-containing protein [Pseudomonadota bacterium]
MEPGFVFRDAGNSREYRTGDWRSTRPEVDKAKCIKCGICYIFCPDMSIRKTDDDYFEVDLYFCKGCGICAQECFIGCITMVAEEE